MDTYKIFNIKGKKAFITGGTGGIGKSSAEILASAGADVALADIPQKMEAAEKTAKELQSKYGIKSIALPVDVSDPVSVDKMVSNAVSAFGTIDIAFNNAGVLNGRTQDHLVEYSNWRRVIDINLGGIFLSARAAARVMIENKNGDSIINMASMSARIVQGGDSSYAVSKAGIVQMTRVMAVQWSTMGIRVNSISPGLVDSGIHTGIPKELLDKSAMKVPLGRFANLNELHGVLLFLASDASSYMTGADILIDGGYTLL
jgi:NAD(P)-dependent dehydrogenase (short-subunit alcohol dehydrogenase family)